MKDLFCIPFLCTAPARNRAGSVGHGVFRQPFHRPSFGILGVLGRVQGCIRLLVVLVEMRQVIPSVMPPSHIATVDSAVEFDGLSGDESRIRISLKSCSDVIVVLVE